MSLRPLHDKVLVRRAEPEEKRGSIVVPDNAKELPVRGEVVAVGDGHILGSGEVIPLEVKAGDQILFTRYAGADIQLDGETLVVMREDEIFAVV